MDHVTRDGETTRGGGDPLSSQASFENYFSSPPLNFGETRNPRRASLKDHGHALGGRGGRGGEG